MTKLIPFINKLISCGMAFIVGVIEYNTINTMEISMSGDSISYQKRSMERLKETWYIWT